MEFCENNKAHDAFSDSCISKDDTEAIPVEEYDV